MSDDLSPADLERVQRKATAFDALMRNLPTAAHPFRGSPAVVEHARAVLAEPAPEQDAPDRGAP